MKPCTSRQLREHGYDSTSRRLGVRFQDGRLYHYKDVPPEIAQAFADAPSQGSHLSRYIKGSYDFELIPEQREDDGA